MPFRRLLPFLLLACALVAPASAGAHGVMRVPSGAQRAHFHQAAAAGAPNPATDPQIASWLQIAQSHWGAGPNCPDGIDITRAQWLPDPGVWAAAVQGGCALAFDPDFYPAPPQYDPAWWQAAMCSVVAHEWGHLLGYGHVNDPNSLMNPVTPINIVAGCPTWGLPTAAPEPSQSDNAASAATPAPKKKSAKKSSKKSCSARSLKKRTKRTKATKRCTTKRRAKRR
jgi:Matrixin